MLRRIATTGLLLTALTACGGGDPSGARPAAGTTGGKAASVAPAAPTEPAAPTVTATAEQSSTPDGPGPVERTLSEMSLEEKVGQLLMPVVYGTAADTVSGENQARYGARTPAEVIAKYHLGGVILFP